MTARLDSVADGKRREALLIAALSALCVVLFFFRLGSRALWDVDEGMHATISKNIVIDDDWVTPTLNGEIFADKPILFSWLVATSFMALGFTELAARLPAAILGLVGVLVTYLLGRRMFGCKVGFLGGVILATSGEYLILSRTVTHDMALAAATTLSLLLFYLGLSKQRSAKPYYLLAYALAAVGVLAKGPLGLLLPALVVGLYLLLTRQLRRIRELQLGWGLLIVVAVCAPWYILMTLRNEGYLAYFLIEQNLARFASSETRHAHPFHYYLPILVGGMFPWSTLLPLAIYRAARRWRNDSSSGVLFLLLWFGGMFLFFSTASSKLPTYLLPLFPAAALILALLWNDLLTAPTPALRRSFLWSLLPMFALMGSITLYARLELAATWRLKYGLEPRHVYALAALFLAGLGIAFVSTWNRRYAVSLAAMVVMMVSTIVLFTLMIAPVLDPYRSTKGLSFELDRLLAPGRPMFHFRRLKDSTLFYTDREALVLRSVEDLEDLIVRDSGQIAVVDLRHLDKLAGLRDQLTIFAQEGTTFLVSDLESSPPPIRPGFQLTDSDQDRIWSLPQRLRIEQP
jgi:4-amino-4-deoxy-L-arabinose transferase-like glycosyltransferase